MDLLDKKSQENTRQYEKLMEEARNEKSSRFVLEMSAKPIKINAGGKVFITSVALFKGNLHEPSQSFQDMFNGKLPLFQVESDTAYFIDCNPVVFDSILTWLRSGVIRVKEEYLEETICMCNQFKLNKMKEKLVEENDDDDAEQMITQLEYYNMKATSSSIGTRTRFENMDFENVEFDGNHHKTSIFVGCIIENKSLKGLFSNCDFYECKMSGCSFGDLLGCLFVKCELIDCIFERTNLYNTKFEECDFEGATFDQNTNFQRCTISNSNLSKVNGIDGAVFKQVDFTGSKFTGSPLTNCTFMNCIIDNIGQEINTTPDLFDYNVILNARECFQVYNMINIGCCKFSQKGLQCCGWKYAIQSHSTKWTEFTVCVKGFRLDSDRSLRFDVHKML